MLRCPPRGGHPKARSQKRNPRLEKTATGCRNGAEAKDLAPASALSGSGLAADSGSASSGAVPPARAAPMALRDWTGSGFMTTKDGSRKGRESNPLDGQLLAPTDVSDHLPEHRPLT